ncbi:MAG TPA: ABC transporter substrate-binding protein, partial [Atribacterota bacterium]|nr:ABC transporter substrate-binding protein [Atribacterota bacterium]
MQKEAGLIAKQARELGITAPFMGGDGVGSPDLVTIGGEATEGFYFTNLADLADPALSEWLKEYRTLYNTDPVLPNPAMAVDALLLVVDAIKRAGTTEGEALASAIENTKNLKVLTTDNFTMDPLTHNPLDKPAVINVVKDGKFEYVMSYSGEN